MSTRNRGATTPTATAAEAGGGEYITVTIAGQLFGIPVLSAQDVLNPQPIIRIPLAPREVAGALNLRGRIVTAIDVRVRLGLPALAEPSRSMGVVCEEGGYLYSLLVDAVGEVLRLPPESYERNPATLQPLWRTFCDGVYRLDGKLLMVLDVERLLRVESDAQAA